MFIISKLKIHNLCSTNKLKMAHTLNLHCSPKDFRGGDNEAVIIYNENRKSILITLKYINKINDSSKVFNFNRKPEEQHSLLVRRISENIGNFLTKKLKTKKSKRNSEEKIVEVKPIEVQLLSKTSQEIPVNASCFDILVANGDNYYLKIEDEKYHFNINPPILTTLNLPRTILAGFLLYPSKVEGLNINLSDSKFIWFKSKSKFKSLADSKNKNIDWENSFEGFSMQTSDDDVGKLIKLECIPYKNGKRGISSEVLSNVLVSAGPGKCPYDERHKNTNSILGSDRFRVVSYNILADLYADSNFSRKNLFPSCPTDALAIDYRKQLLMKEILGYNADVICLQEVDEKLFKRDFQPIFSSHNLHGIYKGKGGSVTEGAAIFYRMDKFRLVEENSFVLKEELLNNLMFTDILDILKLNENSFNVVTSRPTILQSCVLINTKDSSRMLVTASTHLYFDPLSDHIRLLQAWICIKLLQQIIELKKIEYPDRTISLIFCGDFNSDPTNAVYRLFTSQFISEDDADWSSKPEQELQGVSLSHNLKIGSACGTPLYTNYTVGYHGCLDYIFYQLNHLTVDKVISLPTHEEVTAHGALPSVNIPSDHLALVADLKWK